MSMATEKVSEYELKRLENIRRNKEMISALQIHSKASQLSKCPRVVKSVKKPKTKTKIETETLVVTRQSLRTRGIPSIPLTDNKTEPLLQTLDPIPMKDAYKGIKNSDCSFIQSLVTNNQTETLKQPNQCSLKLESMSLNPKYIARVVPTRITQMRFLPSIDVKMIVAGDKCGNIGFWNVGENQVFLYHPHKAYISGIVVQSHCLSKVYTSCYDGFIRMMDVEWEIFDMVYKSSDDECIYSLSQPKNEANCLYFAEGSGGLNVWDNRIGKCSYSSHLALHRMRINTIDFNPENPHIAVTSSTDGTACTWDFRCTGGGMGKGNLKALKTFTYGRGLQSAYFSPSGCSIAITSLDNTIGIYSGVNLEDSAFVYHESCQQLSTFRAIWGWDDSYLFTGSKKRGVAVVSTVQKATVMTLERPLGSAYPVRFDAHSYEVGMLAGGTGGGQVYIWTSSSDF